MKFNRIVANLKESKQLFNHFATIYRSELKHPAQFYIQENTEGSTNAVFILFIVYLKDEFIQKIEIPLNEDHQALLTKDIQKIINSMADRYSIKNEDHWHITLD